MHLLSPFSFYVLLNFPRLILSTPYFQDTIHNLTYTGILTSPGVEAFLGIPYGFSPYRFAPSQPFSPPTGHIFNASTQGHSCPQLPDPEIDPESLITDISEDCLNLNVARPEGAGRKTGEGLLPVMVWIYGGGLNTGSASARTEAPDGLIRQSVEAGIPILYVAMNYRLNIFGFAASEVLRGNNSLNNGLKDQRLALEWVQENIAAFGGDPNRVTIFGQSSGGLSVGMQLLAYGGSKPTPFHSAILQSGSLEAGSSSPITFNTTASIAVLAGCLNTSTTSTTSSIYPFNFTHSSPSQSTAIIDCLRNLPISTLLNCTGTFISSTQAISNDGDIFLPTVDQDFLPFAPSTLVSEGKFAKMPLLLGGKKMKAFVLTYWPGLKNDTVSKLLKLYPSEDFQPFSPETANSTGLAPEFYRSAQIFKDIIFVCPSLLLGEAMAEKYSPKDSAVAISGSNSTSNQEPPIYLFTNNQTLLTPYLSSFLGPAIGQGLGVIHGSELPYVFGNIELYNLTNLGIPFTPTAEDWRLQSEIPRSWSAFAWEGQMSDHNKGTLRGWKSAFPDEEKEVDIYVIGGVKEGRHNNVFENERLGERCAFLNSEGIIAELMY